MPVDKGRIVKSKKGKTGTSHQKNHRWESFTSKISKLNAIAPLRRVRRHDGFVEDFSSTTSYLRTGLEKWQELNTTQDFLVLNRDLLPKCDTLPQILHFEDNIMDLLAQCVQNYISNKEKSTLQTALDLITDFAHDLGERFEKHYARALKLIIAVATMPGDDNSNGNVEVIEWTFNCLAFLFKYLGRLLVSDLRPTYDLIAPLLGKHRQKPHIARFAAEAMSYLIQKASAPATRDMALPLIVRHAKRDLESMAGTPQFGLYYHGLMTMFAEAMKGIALKLHSNAPATLKALVQSLMEGEIDSRRFLPWEDVICGVLTSNVHHTNAETLNDVMVLVLDLSTTAGDTFLETKSLADFRQLLFCTKLIWVVAGVRQGSRIEDWNPVLQTLSGTLQIVSQSSASVQGLFDSLKVQSSEVDGKEYTDDKNDGNELDRILWESLILTIGVTLQYAPMNALIQFVSRFMELLTKEPLAQHFLTFCSYLSEAKPERFEAIAKPYFQKFVIAHWSDAHNGDVLCVLLPKMVSSGVLPGNNGRGGFNLPQSWQDQIVSKFEGLEVKPFPEQVSATFYDPDPSKWVDRCLPKYNALLDVLECTTVHPSTNARIAEILLRKLKLALRPDFPAAPEEAHFIVGRGFSAILRMLRGAGQIDITLRPLLHAKVPDYGRLPDFLEALLTYEETVSEMKSPVQVSNKDDSNEERDPMISSLIANLSTDSKDLRVRSLHLLAHLYKLKAGSASKAISLMVSVEQTALDLETGRNASKHMRELSILYSAEPKESWLRQAIPSFCFGMFTVKFSELWEVASVTLKEISQTVDGEKEVADLAFAWLEYPSWRGTGKTSEPAPRGGLTDFECTNLMKIDQLAKDAALRVLTARGTMLERFATAQQLVDATPQFARSQALRVFSAAPALAEKRSRRLVPMFLSWADRDGDEDDDNDIDNSGADSDEKEKSASKDWSRKDQKSLLDLFGKFSNSRSLYKAEEVYAALLQLLANGDLEIQKSALRAIFAWNNSSINSYEKDLMNLLDEARFRDEIAILLKRESDEIINLQGQTLVKAEHRPDLNKVLLRLLYGRSVSRRGVASGRQGPEARRLMVLRSLGLSDFEDFLDIALGDLKKSHPVTNGVADYSLLDLELISVEKQIGLTNMMEIISKELGTNIQPFCSKIADAVLYCLLHSSRRLQRVATKQDIAGTDHALQRKQQVEEEPNNTGGSSVQIQREGKTKKLLSVRQIGLKCLNILMTNSSDTFDWSPYIERVISDTVQPKLDNFAIENAEGVSVTLRLFNTWSTSTSHAMFFNTNDQVLPKITECIALPRSKVEVKVFVLTILRNLIKISSGESGAQVREVILKPNMDFILTQIGAVLRSKVDIEKVLLESCVDTVSELAPLVSNSTQAHNLVDVSIFLLDQPSRRVNPRTKSGLLRILEHFVSLYDLQNDETLKDSLYTTITRLFGFFTDRPSREVLSRVLVVYSKQDPVIGEVAELCADLNSFPQIENARLGERGDAEPDYDRRRKAHDAIESKREVPFTPQQWAPLLYNMLFYLGYEESFHILSDYACDSICFFITASAENKTAFGKANFEAFKKMHMAVLIPAVLRGAREVSDVIRQKYVKIMGHLVFTFPEWPEVNDMHSLLAGDDELESSFFRNILTTGKGRQSNALTQLRATAENGGLGSKNASQFFIPLIEHFILNREEGSDAHNLAADATTTIGVLAKSLEWPQYRAMLRRFIGYVKEKPELTKQIIKLLEKVTDALAFAAQDSVLAFDSETAPRHRCALSTSMPKDDKLAVDITKNIMPPLTEYLHDKDESTVSLRVPVAIIVVKLLKLLPQDQLSEHLAPVLTDVCHILRSKSQEARDMTRDTLTKICVLLGPSCFGFVLKELRSALARGSQLHILSYTMHSILVACTPEYAPGDLDYCLPSIVNIIMDDIFGATGQEKDAEEYASKMKEVKSSKSHDSMELISRTATLTCLNVLVKPIQALLREKVNLKMIRKIDELLNRISTGLLLNSAAGSRDSLIFCHNVITDFYESKNPEIESKVNQKLRRYLIQKGAKKSDRGNTTVCTYKLVRFAFDVMRVVLKKHESLQTVNNLAGFVPVLEDAIAEGEEEVKTSTFRLLTVIIKKVRFEPDADGTSVYTRATSEATRSIKGSTSTTSDISQAALKLLSVVLRTRQDIPVKDKAIDDILDRLKEDMTEPERRHITFNFLRAILDAKVETAVVYDKLDSVAKIMVQNPDEETRKLARGAYFQFLRDYPQHQKRWSKQLRFITENLAYKGEGGRLSILELILLLLTKSTGDEYVQAVSKEFFLPLALVHNNDESKQCRDAAGELIKIIFAKADEEHLAGYLDILRSRMKISETSTPEDHYLRGFLLKIWGFYFEGLANNGMTSVPSDVPMLLGVVTDIIELVGSDEARWQQLLAALNLASTLTNSVPEYMLSVAAANFWTLAPQCLTYPHAWVKLSATKLIKAWTTDFARANSSGFAGLPCRGSNGLKLTGDKINDLTRRLANMYNTPNLTTELAVAVNGNLAFLALVADANSLAFKGPKPEDVVENEDADEPEEKRTTLQYLFVRLGYILRRELSAARAPALIPKVNALQLVEALTGRLSAISLLPCLKTVLLPLNNFTDKSIPVPWSIDEDFKSGYESLQTNSETLKQALREKLGTSAFTEAELAVKRGVVERRNARSAKRKIEAISLPERHGQQKKKKVERKKERRREKGQEHALRRKEY